MHDLLAQSIRAAGLCWRRLPREAANISIEVDPAWSGRLRASTACCAWQGFKPSSLGGESPMIVQLLAVEPHPAARKRKRWLSSPPARPLRLLCSGLQHRPDLCRSACCANPRQSMEQGQRWPG
jgi:hypothetical protein